MSVYAGKAATFPAKAEDDQMYLMSLRKSGFRAQDPPTPIPQEFVLAKCSDNKHMPSHPGCVVLGVQCRASCVLGKHSSYVPRPFCPRETDGRAGHHWATTAF